METLNPILFVDIGSNNSQNIQDYIIKNNNLGSLITALIEFKNDSNNLIDQKTINDELLKTLKKINSQQNENDIRISGYAIGHPVIFSYINLSDPKFDKNILFHMIGSLIAIKEMMPQIKLFFSFTLVESKKEIIDFFKELNSRYNESIKNYFDSFIFFVLGSENIKGKSIIIDGNTIDLFSTLAQLANFIFHNTLRIQAADFHRYLNQIDDEYTFLGTFGISSIVYPKFQFINSYSQFGCKVFTEYIVDNYNNEQLDHREIVTDVKEFLSNKSLPFFDTFRYITYDTEKKEEIFRSLDFPIGEAEDVGDYDINKFFIDFRTKFDEFTQNMYQHEIIYNLKTRKDSILKKCTDILASKVNNLVDKKSLLYSLFF